MFKHKISHIDHFYDTRDVHNNQTANLMERHQIWYFKNESISPSSSYGKTRSWYIINPRIGNGCILAAPISKTNSNGIRIDIGTNFFMHILLSDIARVNIGNAITYIGVAPKEIRNKVDQAIRFLYLGEEECLLDELKDQNIEYSKSLEKMDKNPLPYRVYGMGFDVNQNRVAAYFARYLRNTPIGEDPDIRAVILANFPESADADMLTRHKNDNTAYTRKSTNRSTFGDSLKDTSHGELEEITIDDSDKSDETIERDSDESNISEQSEVLDLSEFENGTLPRWEIHQHECRKKNTSEHKLEAKMERVKFRELSREELLFIQSYKNTDTVVKLFGYPSRDSVYAARKRLRNNPKIIDKKPIEDVNQYLGIYKEVKTLVDKNRSFDIIESLSRDKILMLRKFLCSLGNHHYPNLRAIPMISYDHIIETYAKIIYAYYNKGEH